MNLIIDRTPNYCQKNKTRAEKCHKMSTKDVDKPGFSFKATLYMDQHELVNVHQSLASYHIKLSADNKYMKYFLT